jgi:cell division protein FtsL
VDNTGFPKNISRAPGRIKLFVFILLAAGLTIFYVSNVIEVRSILKEINEIDKRRTAIENKNQLLTKKINELESPERITKLASEKSGLVKAEEPPSVIK